MKRNKIVELLFLAKSRCGNAAAFLLGLISAVAQVVLIRELMTAFSGHELVFAIVLGAWLLGVALGSLLIRSKDIRMAGWLLAISVILFPLTVLGARLLKPALGIALGSVTGMGVVAAAAAGLLLPLTMALGGVFSVLSLAGHDGKKIYAWEALGFVAGGIMMTFVFMAPFPGRVALWSEQLAWPGYQVLAFEQTRYGHLAVVERGGQKSFYDNGRHIFSTNDASAAEEVHAGLLAHPQPKVALLIGGGVSLAGREALKQPLDHLDYVEMDPAAIRLEQEHISRLDDTRLHILTGDPRVILARSKQVYDVIVVNAGDPVAISAGRFFTQGFFMAIRAHLAKGGLMSITINSSEDDVNAQGKSYGRCVMATLLSVFKDVQLIPGERMTFMAGDVLEPVTAKLFIRRLKERGVKAQFMREYYLNDRMSPERMAQARAWAMQAGEVSTDERPIVSLRALIFATTRAGTGFSKFMDALQACAWVLWCVIPCIFFTALKFRPGQIPLAGAACAGFTQMVFQIAAIFAVQVAFGNAYALIGILTAGFMLGAFLGVGIYQRLMRVIDGEIAALLQIFMAVSFMLALRWPQVLLGFPIFAGLAGGIQFAVYASMAKAPRAAAVYAADVLGAAGGALCAGVFLLPLWGMIMTILFVAMLNFAMVVLFKIQPGKLSADL